MASKIAYKFDEVNDSARRYATTLTGGWFDVYLLGANIEFRLPIAGSTYYYCSQ